MSKQVKFYELRSLDSRPETAGSISFGTDSNGLGRMYVRGETSDYLIGESLNRLAVGTSNILGAKGFKLYTAPGGNILRIKASFSGYDEASFINQKCVIVGATADYSPKTILNVTKTIDNGHSIAIITLDQSTTVTALTGKEDTTSNTYDYLLLIDSPSLGDINIGFDNLAVGRGNKALAKSSIAFGTDTYSYGKFSTTFGSKTYAGHMAFATGSGTMAYGTTSFTGGTNTITRGSNAVALGHSTEANGDGSFAMGYKDSGANIVTKASGKASFAIGVGAEASGVASGAVGVGTIAGTDYMFACGKYNESGHYYFAVGAGSNKDTRRNALSVTKNGLTNIATLGVTKMIAQFAADDDTYFVHNWDFNEYGSMAGIWLISFRGRTAVGYISEANECSVDLGDGTELSTNAGHSFRLFVKNTKQFSSSSKSWILSSQEWQLQYRKVGATSGGWTNATDAQLAAGDFFFCKIANVGVLESKLVNGL